MKAWIVCLSLLATILAVSPLSAKGRGPLTSHSWRVSHSGDTKKTPKYAFRSTAKFSVYDVIAGAKSNSTSATKNKPVSNSNLAKAAAPRKKGAEPVGKTNSETETKDQNSTFQQKGPKVNPEETPCSLNVEDFDLNKILRELSSMSGANLLLLSSPEQKLTLRLTNVKMIDMLRHVCAITGMSYLKIGETYVVAAEEKLKRAYPAEWEALNPPLPPPPPAPESPKPITSLYMLTNITADKAAEVIKKAFPNDRVSAIAGPQYISPSLNVKDTAASTGISGTATERSDKAGQSKALVLIGLPADIELAKDILKKIDQERPQVLIAVTITDITNDALKDVGLSWTFGDVTLTESTPNGVNFGSISRASQSMAAKLTSLIKTNNAKLLTSTSLSVLDGESAFMLIGDKINYPVLIGYTQANTPIFSKETERVGIYLQLSCFVSDDGAITLTLYPQVSSVTGFLEVNGASYPQISTREAQTTLRFRSGETIVMGGLMKDEDIVGVDRVPILSKIPILGELFKHRKTTKAKSQVIITITPTILVSKEP